MAKYKFILFIGFLSLLSCRQIEEKNILGIYICPDMSDTLILKNDRTYIYKNYKQNFHDKWTLKGSTVEFMNFKETGGVWPAMVEFHNDTIRIIYADEEGIYYHKIK